jgi:hypothetical protein
MAPDDSSRRSTGPPTAKTEMDVLRDVRTVSKTTNLYLFAVVILLALALLWSFISSSRLSKQLGNLQGSVLNAGALKPIDEIDPTEINDILGSDTTAGPQGIPGVAGPPGTSGATGPRGLQDLDAADGLDKFGNPLAPVLKINDSDANGLTIVSDVLTINDTVANGLILIGDALAVNVADGLARAGDAVAVVAANTTIAVSPSGISVGIIGDSNIAFGVGTGMVSASDIPITDAGGFYNTDTVEAAFAQIAGADITSVGTAAGTGLQGGATSGSAALSLLTTCAPGEILKWGGAAWACGADDDSGGTVTSVTGGSGLASSGTAQVPVLDINDSATNGLVITADILNINDNATNGLALVGDVLTVSTGNGLGLSGNTVVAVAADTTITVAAGGIAVGVIGDSNIAFGVGAGTVSGADIPIADTGAFYTTNDVESALAQIQGADITSIGTAAGTGLTGGTISGAAALSLLTSCAPSEILKWNGLAWTCAADDSAVGSVNSVTAGAGIGNSGTAVDPILDINDSASNGLVITADILTINDNAANGLALVGDVLTVSTGDGLGFSGNSVVAVAANSTITVGAGGISVGTIGDANINFGTGAGQVSGVDLPIADTGGFYTTDNVEAALAQIQGADITAVGTAAGTGLEGGVTSGSAALSLISTCGSNEILKWTGAVWACATDEDSGGTVTSVTAGSGLSDSGTASDPILDINDSATNGLVITADILTINDNAANGLALVGDVLTVSTGNGLGLSGNTVVAVAANSTITVGAGGISVGVIGDTNINFGTGAGQVSAVDLPIADTGAFYTTDNVEAALAQIQGADITAVGTAAGTGLEGGVSSGAAALSLLTTCGSDEILKWTGAAWACAPDEDAGGTVTSVTAGSGVGNSGTAADPILDINDSATNGLVITADILTINDNATNGLALVGDVLTVSTGNGLGLSGNTVVAVATDSTIAVGAGGIAVGIIGDSNIAFGVGSGTVSGADIPIADIGGFYTTNDVESALAQIQGADITSVGTAAGTGLEGGATSGAAALSLLTTCGTDEILKWTGAAWACAPDEDAGGTVTSVTAGSGLANSGTAQDPILDVNDSATNGLVIAADILAINDNATNGLALVGDVLTVSTGNGLGLSGNTIVAVAADSTITVGAGGISVGIIGDSDIAFGVGAGTVSGADIPIADVGGFYTTNEVESALAQIQGADITSVGTAAGTGLEGGVTSGAAALSLLTTCANDEILKWTGAVWACAPDEDSGGTVTSVTAGSGVSNSGTAQDPIIDINDSATNGLVITADILNINDNATNGLALVGDVLTVSTGNGLGLSGNTVVAVAANSTITVGAGGISVGTIGDSNINFGTGAGQVSAVDLPIADTGTFYITDDVESALAQIQGADITAVGTAAGTGLEGGVTSGAAALSLLTTCANDEILKWTGAAWACSPDDSASGVNSVTAGAGIVNSGTAADPILDIGAGNGITVNANDVALGPLTGDWDQTGAFDIALNNADSELKILESVGDTYFGILEVGDLGSADAIYTLSGTSGLILTSANYATTLDSAYVNVAESPAAADITGSFSAGLTVGANTVALGTDTTGNYVESITAGLGLVGTVAPAEGTTPTFDIVSGNGGIVVGTDALTLTLTTSGTTGSASSNSGLEVTGGAGGLSLLKGCADGQLLEWTDAGGWACADDDASIVSAIRWDQITSPTGPLSLVMNGNTSTFTYGATTGAGVNLFKLVDTASNTGTGYIMDIETAALSNAKPLAVVARGNTIIDTTSTGGVTIGNATAAQAVTIDAGTGTLNLGNSNNAKAINVGTGTAADTIHIGDGGTGADIITIGANVAGQTLTLDAGTAATAIQIGNSATDHGIQIGTGAALQTIVMGSTNGASITTLQSGTGHINLQAAGTTTVDRIQIGAGGAGNSTPDYLGLDVKSDTGDPADGFEGAMYYNTFDNKFRCFEGAAWKDCDTGTSSLSFTNITGGTNSSAAMVVDTGASLTASGSGSIIATGVACTDCITLTTETAGDYVAGFTAGSGLTGDASGEASAPTLAVGAGNGITVNANDITLALTTSGTTGATSSNSGLEVLAGGLTLLKGCADNNILKWTDAGGWACQIDETGGGSATLQSAYDNDTVGGNVVVGYTTADDSIIFQNPASGGTASAFLLQLDQVSSSAVDGLLINSVASGMTDAINVTDTDIVNAINIGTNTILGTTGVIDFTNFDVASTGALTFTGVTTDITTGTNEDLNLAPNGTGEVTIGASDTTGMQLVLDTKTDAGDPTGINGGMYYNSNMARFRCFENTVWVNCTGRQIVVLGGDVADSSGANTITNLTGMSFPVTNGERTSWECSIYYTAAATTTGSRWSMSGPTTTQLNYYSEYTLTATTQTVNPWVVAYDTPAAASATSVVATNRALIQGTVLPSADGTMQVRFATEIDTSAITAKAGSYCEYWNP